MPRPSRVCSVLDCGRTHHAGGFCRVHYGEQVRKSAKKERSESRPSQAAQRVIHTGDPLSSGTQEPEDGGGRYTSKAKVGTYATVLVAPPSFSEIPLWMQAGMVALYLCAFVVLLALAVYILGLLPRFHDFLDRITGGEDATDA